MGRKGDGDCPRPSLPVTRPQGIFSYLEHKLVEVGFEAAEGWQTALRLNKRKLAAQGWRAWGKPGWGGGCRRGEGERDPGDVAVDRV